MGLFYLLLSCMLSRTLSQVCHSSCLSCTGTLSTNCLSCVSGLFLLGSSCITACPYKTMPSTRTCVTACPSYYFQNSLNGFCENCQEGCITCDSTGSCYDDGTNNNSNTVLDYLTLWIVLTILGLIIVAILLWKICCAGKTFADKMEEEVIDHQAKPWEGQKKDLTLSNEAMEARWVEDIDDLHLTKIRSRHGKKKEEIQGIGKELNNI